MDTDPLERHWKEQQNGHWQEWGTTRGSYMFSLEKEGEKHLEIFLNSFVLVFIYLFSVTNFWVKIIKQENDKYVRALCYLLESPT